MKSSTTIEKPDFDAIRRFYRHHRSEIEQAGRSVYGIDPYAWEFDARIRLTPIERALWHDIRTAGIVMYPQFPVGRRFVDFGNPCARVAIECDGEAWHQDKAADQARQEEIERAGWVVYRFTGSECMALDAEDEAGRWAPSATFRRVREIGERHEMRLWNPRRHLSAPRMLEDLT